MADAHQTISRLHAAAASGEQESQATVSSLLSELAEKSSQLVDAERRFSELEAMMQRIASRTGQGPLLAAEGQEDFGHEQQRLPLRNSWGLQQFQQQCGVGVSRGLAAASSYSSPTRGC